MKIRPLKKIGEGHYASYDETIKIYCEDIPKGWSAYEDDKYIFYETYPTLKSLIKALKSL